MNQTDISLSETKSIQETARKNFADGKFSLTDYLATIINNPLKFTSSNRSRLILAKEKGKIRVIIRQQKINSGSGNKKA